MEAAAKLILILPIFSALMNGILGAKITKRQARLIASVIMSIVTFLSCWLFYKIAAQNQPLHIVLATWIQLDDLIVNWSIYLDALSSLMFLIVTLVSTVVHIYSLGYMHDDKNLAKFLSFLSLFTFFMLVLVAADNFFQLFFGWEGVGFCSYLLIGFWYAKPSANEAAIKAFVVNRIGDVGLILGIIIIISRCGSGDFITIFAAASELAQPQFSLGSLSISYADIICLLLFIGCMGKSAQLGLHVWLPDAMEGPTPVSALIHAATMVTAGVFLVARCSYLFEYSKITLEFMLIIGGITCFVAATIAVTQPDIKKIIAYSTCSQLGYMFAACGVSAYRAAVFHLATHAFFKALLFLSAGNVIHACHQQNIFKIGGLYSKMPNTYLNFWLASLALVGIYPLAGFYSKDIILESLYAADSMLGYIVFILGLVSAILTAIYSMKIILLTFHGKTRLSDSNFQQVQEAGLIMNLPLGILVLGSFIAGMIGYYTLTIDKPYGYLADSIFNLHLAKHHVPNLIKLLPFIVGSIGMGIGILLYRKVNSKQLGLSLANYNFIYHLVRNKYYFDEAYNYLIVKPAVMLSRFLYYIDQKIIDRFGPGSFSNMISSSSSLISCLQTGYVFHYTLYIILATIIGIIYLIINTL